MNLTVTKDGVLLSDIDNFDLALTLDCGQAFRWSQDDNGCWWGIVGNRPLKLLQNEKGILFYNTTVEDFETYWREYFDIDRNYGEIIKQVSVHPVLEKATQLGGGIRILKQQPFETLCSFIISQNNNIPRIKGIIDRLCTTFGKKEGGMFTFPEAQVLAALTVEDLAPIRSGFRAKYIIDAAQKCTTGEVDFEKVYKMPLEQAREHLMQIKGVGKKVADCTLLFGFGKIDAFPRDVWINKAMDKLFDGVLPECALENAGIIQQYIFHYARTLNI